MPKAVLSKKEVMARLFKLAWLLLACAALAASLLLHEGRPNSDADVLLGYSMLALSFPVGTAVAACVGILGRALFEANGYVFTTSYTLMVIVWLSFSIAGYWQWFVLVPKLLSWWHARRTDASVRS